jgi:hypothetical protein
MNGQIKMGRAKWRMTKEEGMAKRQTKSEL